MEVRRRTGYRHPRYVAQGMQPGRGRQAVGKDKQGEKMQSAVTNAH